MSDTQELIGHVFDSRYQITELVGRGGMGAVYKAVHIAMNQVVALKVLGKALSRDERTVQRFYQEARSSSRLKHPNTIKVFDFGRSEEGQLYLAMEFLEGLTLTQLLRQEKVLSIRRSINIAKQVAKSLGEAHGSGLVHRDLKPDNVFITHVFGEEDFVKVLDFGIAKASEGSPDPQDLTAAGLVCGTPLYISPEQALGRGLDGRSDLYSLGVILYEMVCGRPPFRGETPVALVMKHIHESPPPMSDHNPSLVVPESLRSLIFRLLDKDRDQRPATAQDLLTAFDAVLAAGGFPDEPSRAVVAEPAVPAPPVATVVGRPVVGKAVSDTDEGIEFLVDLHEEATEFLQTLKDSDPADAATTFMKEAALASQAARGSGPLPPSDPERTELMQPGELLAGLQAAAAAAGHPVPQVRTSTQGQPKTKLRPSTGSMAPVGPAAAAQRRPAAHGGSPIAWVLGGAFAASAIFVAVGLGLGWISIGPAPAPVAAAVQPAPVPPVAAQPVRPAPVPAPAPAPAPTPVIAPIPPAPGAATPAAAPAGVRSVAVALETVPPGASARFGDRDLGRTPVSLLLRDGDPPAAVVFRTPGYRDLAVTLNPRDVIATGKAAFRWELAPLEGTPPPAARPAAPKPAPTTAAARPEKAPAAAAAAPEKKAEPRKAEPKKSDGKTKLNWDD